MMDPDQIDRDIDELLVKIREKFGIKAQNLSQAMQRIGRRFPKFAHQAAAELQRFQDVARQPRLSKQLDAKVFKKQSAVLLRQIDAYDACDARAGWWLGMLGGLVFNLILVFTLIVAFMRWQGLL